MNYDTRTKVTKLPLFNIAAKAIPNQLAILSMDIITMSISLWSAYLIRFEGTLTTFHYQQLLILIPCLTFIKLPIFSMFGMYQGMWRYTSLKDIANILRGSIVSSAIIITALIMVNRFDSLSRAVFILDSIFTFLLITCSRVGIRYTYQINTNPQEILNLLLPNRQTHNDHSILLIGAGNSAEKILREIQENKKLNIDIVGLIDDDPQKRGKAIHGIPILGSLDELEVVVGQLTPAEIIITISTATREQMRRINKICRRTNIPFKILPGMQELIYGDVSLQSVREVSYTDLLGRATVKLEQDEIGKCLTGKTILVTGAGGSIGSELCRQIVKFEPEKIILLDAGEENLYNIQMELHHEYDFSNYIAVLGKIQNRNLLDFLFAEHKPAVVFHAAAYKHVPLVEQNPWEAVFNNVFAVRNVIETSINYNVERFVLVSTDKAVRPTNVMGATKRLTELLMLAYSQENWDASICESRQEWLQTQCSIKNNSNNSAHCTHSTTFMAVRFGNVLGSSGSVIPLFKRQIKMGGPITVTHPDVTRYFMSIEEAAQLILQAGTMGAGGEIFILKMGKSIKIAEMAKDLITMSGKELNKDIDIKFTGLRPGEKLYEELITEGEGIVDTKHEKIMVLKGDGKEYSELEKPLQNLAEAAQSHDAKSIKKILSQIIPEYIPDMEAKAVTLEPLRQEKTPA